MAEERLQKILARAGIASRRKAEALITAGRVRVDGKVVTELGAKANPKRAKVELDGKRLEPEPLCYGIMHKPRGMLTTLADPEGRPTAYDVLKQVGVRVVPVGRLDFNTSGALLFTNDGDFAQVLTHASGKASKVYAAKVQQIVDETSLTKWAEAIEIEGKLTRPANVRILRREGDKTWLEITLAEGRNRQVRRLGEHANTPVVRLSRLSHADISTEGLKPGQWRLLTLDELRDLKKRFGVPAKVRASMSGPSGEKAVRGVARPNPLAGRPGAKKSGGGFGGRSGSAGAPGRRPEGAPGRRPEGAQAAGEERSSARFSKRGATASPSKKTSGARPGMKSAAGQAAGGSARSGAVARSGSSGRAGASARAGGTRSQASAPAAGTAGRSKRGGTVSPSSRGQGSARRPQKRR